MCTQLWRISFHVGVPSHILLCHCHHLTLQGEVKSTVVYISTYLKIIYIQNSISMWCTYICNHLLMVATLGQTVINMSPCAPCLTCLVSHLSWTNHLRRTDPPPTPGLATHTRCSKGGNKQARGAIKHGVGHFTSQLLNIWKHTSTQWVSNE